MKKLLFIIICAVQLIQAQNTIVGEYVSTTKNSNGIKLFFQEDGTYQISVFSGKYKVINDSIVFENDNKQNSYHLLFENGKKYSEKITIKVEPINYYSIFQSDYLGIQKTETSEIEYQPLKDYFNKNEIENFLQNSYKIAEAVKENDGTNTEKTETKITFEIDRVHALYFVKKSDYNSVIEKYIVPRNVNVIDVTFEDSYLANLNLTGKINKANNVLFLTDGKNPLNFTKKSALIQPNYISPTTKSSEKNWSYPGMKNNEEYYDYDDSTAVAVDTAYAVSENRYEFKSKVENSLKEALLNIKKDTAKYLMVYYNLKDQRAAKNFNTFVNNYDENASYNMYEGYNSEYDTYNFYLATNSDEAFFKKNNIKEKSVVILNKDGKIIATSTKSLDDVANILNYDNSFLINKLKETENAMALSNSVTNKKTSIPELTKSLNKNYKDIYTERFYFANTTIDTVVAVDDYQINDENNDEKIAVDQAVEAAVAEYETNDFTFYKTEVSEKLIAEKLNTIFEYYNSKNILNDDLVNILLGEISGNHLSFDLFKNENNGNNKQEIKYINYILKYNKEVNIKNKIAKVINNVIAYKSENPDSATYTAIAHSLIAYSDNDLTILNSVLNLYNQKEKASEAANQLVDLYYSTLVNNKPLFENIDEQYIKSNATADYKTDWISFKNQINSLFNAQAWDIFELNKTKDFERAIKWSELSNIIEKENPYSLDTLGQLYFAVGRKKEAIAIQTKAVEIAKAMEISPEEFENALNNMKK